MPAIFLYPLLSGVGGYFLGLFTSDSMGFLKWLLVVAAAFYVANKAGVI